MADNVIRLPRPNDARPASDRLGLYLRVGFNQHSELLEVMAGGEHDFHGLVIEAQHAKRHAELRSHALRAGMDVVLDPKTHAMALPGSFGEGLAALPWSNEEHHTARDFEGDAGRAIAEKIAHSAVGNGFTQVLGPTHLLSGANDRWLRLDIANMGHLHTFLDAAGSGIELIYPLALPIGVWRDPVERAAIVAAIADAPADSLWLRIENFGSGETGDKTIAYIEAAREFHDLGIPVIADHAGGLSGLGLLAFGAVSGLAHGITMLEGFKAYSWRRPRMERPQSGGPVTRVYIPRLDLHLTKEEARAFLKSSTRTMGRFGCRDTHCCPGGIDATLDNPTRHFVHQRSNEIAVMSGVPQSLRPTGYLERNVRPATGDVSAAFGLGAISDELKGKFEKKLKAMERFQQAMSHFLKVDEMRSTATVPQRRGDRAAKK